MTEDEIRVLARSLLGTERPRSAEQLSWLHRGRMTQTQRIRLAAHGERPPCFATDRDWYAWCILETVVPIADGSSYCYDCRACFKREAMAAGRCQHPTVEFRRFGQPPTIVGQRLEHRGLPEQRKRGKPKKKRAA